MMRLTWPNRVRCLGLLLAGCVILAAGCGQRVAPIRTLPSWVRGIFVPMFKNSSYEPQVEETLTRAVQEAFLADGRLDIVPEKDADLLLRGEVTDWSTRSARTRGDHISTSDEVTATIELKLYEPLNPKEPLAVLPPVLIRNNFYTDTRSVDFVPEPDRKQALLTQAAGMIVDQTLNGFPVQLRGVPAGAALPAMEPAPQADLAPTQRRSQVE